MTMAETTSPAVHIFGSDKGGVGKTLAAQVAITRLLTITGRLPVIIEVEAEARLGAIYGTKAVRSFILGANTMEELERNPRLIYAMWNDLGELLLENEGRDVVLDLGANLTRSLMVWLDEFGADGPLGTGERVRFYALTTGETASLTSASNALGYAAHSLPASTRTLLLNERDEALFPLAPDAPAVRSLLKTHGANAACFPRCMSPALAQVVDQRMRLDDALAQPVDFWAGKGMKRMDAILAVRRLTSWGEAAMSVFGSLPATAPA
ncbi:hypothetical protein EAH89_18110 [Roseomonas nepalensis]|uniref:ParA family protein n=2 Tax=Muricoccus nepalensis TaxID=1854500 RepID=A0A502FSU7_9PROT|nr:hypothetical protein EAH89_18110 [Roseomonas nepalensis]